MCADPAYCRTLRGEWSSPHPISLIDADHLATAVAARQRAPEAHQEDGLAADARHIDRSVERDGETWLHVEAVERVDDAEILAVVRRVVQSGLGTLTRSPVFCVVSATVKRSLGNGLPRRSSRSKRARTPAASAREEAGPRRASVTRTPAPRENPRRRHCGRPWSRIILCLCGKRASIISSAKSRRFTFAHPAARPPPSPRSRG